MNEDLEGEPLAKPFLYFSTGNPPKSGFAGRREFTDAELRRQLSVTMKAPGPTSRARLRAILPRTSRTQNLLGKVTAQERAAARLISETPESGAEESARLFRPREKGKARDPSSCTIW